MKNTKSKSSGVGRSNGGLKTAGECLGNKQYPKKAMKMSGFKKKK